MAGTVSEPHPDINQFNCRRSERGTSHRKKRENSIHQSSVAEYHPLKAKPVMNRRGNPNWGQLILVGPAVPTEFELQVRQLRLTPETYALSHELRRWCERNRNRFYIPEWLLDVWDIPVDPDLSAA